MTEFNVHTIESAPDASKEILKGVREAYGFIPNLMSLMSESPILLEAYATIANIFDKSDFSPTERQIVLMTNNRLHGCTYCMAAHTTISKMQGLPADVIGSLRTGASIADPKLEALRVFTVQVNENRGSVSDADIEAFLAAGYSKANILEVITGTAQKIMSNYTNHIAKTPLDEGFKADTWAVDTANAA